MHINKIIPGNTLSIMIILKRKGPNAKLRKAPKPNSLRVDDCRLIPNYRDDLLTIKQQFQPWKMALYVSVYRSFSAYQSNFPTSLHGLSRWSLFVF